MSDFSMWLKANTALSDSSIYKYSHAADTVMEEMLALGVIDKPFSEMTEIEIDIAIAVILHDQHFIKKNTRGNAMYSNALKQYRPFRRDETVVDIEKDSSVRGSCKNMRTVALSQNRQSKITVGEPHKTLGSIHKYGTAKR